MRAGGSDTVQKNDWDLLRVFAFSSVPGGTTLLSLEKTHSKYFSALVA